ncbi:MAG: putative ABC transporter ATP-binding protein YbhF [candidate division WS2 bacterium ADurb.Bin280]|uniref:Putative ABC transporter ATP-binding protein YbhF n=1 Tax=candidate division WS2 bacterium ADurb.Bin280 TaxID=1852829 RepID=A0A1V5SDN6_9BACT|nr:MAG: putative ABC transporter ATP-binding protein YbhF [candidate division WS2 bacterium ADurb.Bin280]
MANILEVKNLRKNYGNFEAVKGIDFEIGQNEIFALIGPNGAGKSTTLKMIGTILQPTGGEIYIDGVSVIKNPDEARKKISYLPEEVGAYKNLTGRGYLKLMAGLYTDNKKLQIEFVERAIEICNLKKRIDDKLGAYSKGMVRKVMLARALMSEPKLAILDEATSGLDVINAIEIRNIIIDYAKRGTTVLVSSHNMLEIEYLSNKIGIIDQGKIVENGTVGELKSKYKANNLEEVFLKIKIK